MRHRQPAKKTPSTPTAQVVITSCSFPIMLVMASFDSLSTHDIAALTCLLAVRPTSVSMSEGMGGLGRSFGTSMSGISISWCTSHSCWSFTNLFWSVVSWLHFPFQKCSWVTHQPATLQIWTICQTQLGLFLICFFCKQQHSLLLFTLPLLSQCFQFSHF